MFRGTKGTRTALSTGDKYSTVRIVSTGGVDKRSAHCAELICLQVPV